MKTISDLKGYCRIEQTDSGSPHWLWAGSKTATQTRIWAPDFTATKKAFEAAIAPALAAGDDAAIVDAIVQAMSPIMMSQSGRRAAYHLTHQKPLPAGWRVFSTCREMACVEHFGAGPMVVVGREIARMGHLKNSIRRKIANRATGRARSKLTPDIIREIQHSNDSGLALAKRFSIGPSLVSKVRVHGSPSHQPLGGLFSGLMGRSA